jgi:hypothetical protein
MALTSSSSVAYTSLKHGTITLSPQCRLVVYNVLSSALLVHRVLGCPVKGGRPALASHPASLFALCEHQPFLDLPPSLLIISCFLSPCSLPDVHVYSIVEECMFLGLDSVQNMDVRKRANIGRDSKRNVRILASTLTSLHHRRTTRGQFRPSYAYSSRCR